MEELVKCFFFVVVVFFTCPLQRSENIRAALNSFKVEQQPGSVCPGLAARMMLLLAVTLGL